MSSLENNLQELGISGKEAEVYMATLKLKKATVIQLAKATNVKRTTVYHCLDALIEKELIIKLIKDDKTFYVAEDPKASLSNLLQAKKNAIDSALPELKSIFGKEGIQPEIRVYRTLQGIRRLFEDALTNQEKKERYYLSDFDLEEFLGVEFANKFIQNRIKAGIKSLSLRSFKYKPEREKGIIHTKELREVKYIPEHINIKPYMCVYDNKVAFISPKEERLGFIVESREFAEMQKAIFDMIWNTIAI